MASDGTLKFDTKLDSSGFSAGLKTLGAVTGAAVGAATAGLVALGKSAIEEYANYEQLVGGVETLFGLGGQSLQEFAEANKLSAEEAKDAWLDYTAGERIVLNNAEKAFKTAGLSQNAYMETVTGFSASLIQSLDGDTKKAAEVADRAVTDMADNANKMGSSIESIQNAYQGFAKQNYTMLDNLKLGYGGTKEEMQRLISEASKMTDVQKKLNVEVKDGDMSFANIANAISVVQENMGIAGTTALEASTTIQGSISQLGGAWTNFVSGLADSDSNIASLAQNVIDSFMAVTDNLIPVIVQLLPTIGEGITQLINQLAPLLPDLLTQLEQPFLSGVTSLFTALVQIIPDILAVSSDLASELLINVVTTLIDNAPQLLTAAVEIISKLADFCVDNIDFIIDSAVELILALVDTLCSPESIAKLLEAATLLIVKLSAGIIIHLPEILAAGLQIIYNLLAGIVQAAPQLWDKFKEIIAGIPKRFSDSWQKFKDIGLNVVKGIWEGISSAASWLWNLVSGWCSNLMGKIKGFFGIASPSKLFKNIIGKNLMLGLAEGIDDEADSAVAAMGRAAKDIADIDFEPGPVNLSALEDAKIAVAAESGSGIAGREYALNYDPDYDPDDDPEPNDRYVETHIHINDKEVAKVLTPAISKRLAWEG